MEIQKQFCPRCGGPTEGGICRECRAKEIDWLVCDPRITITFCPSCDSVRHGSTWTDVPVPREELVASEIHRAVRVHPDVRGPEVSLRMHDPSPNRTICTVDASGTLLGVPVFGSCTIEVVWKKEQCDRCSRYSGGYYEGIVQLRAEGRKPTPFEIERTSAMAHAIEDQVQAGGERLSFIVKEEETKDGLDITVGSHHLGELISREVTRELGGKFTTHPKLVGERDGKRLFRITYAIRLSRFQKGDVIESEGRYYEVRETLTHGLRVFDLVTGQDSVLRGEGPYRSIGNVREAARALVAYTDGDIAGIMDPESYRTEECPAHPWLALKEGSYVRVLRDKEMDRIVPVG